MKLAGGRLNRLNVWTCFDEHEEPLVIEPLVIEPLGMEPLVIEPLLIEPLVIEPLQFIEKL